MNIYLLMFTLSFWAFFVSLFFLIRSLYMDKDNFIVHAELFFVSLFLYIVSWSTQLSILPLLSSSVDYYYGYVVMFRFQSVFLSVLFFCLIIGLMLFFRQIVKKR